MQESKELETIKTHVDKINQIQFDVDSDLLSKNPSVAELIDFLVLHGNAIELNIAIHPSIHALFTHLGITKLAVPLDQILSWNLRLQMQEIKGGYVESFEQVKKDLNKLKKLIYSAWDESPFTHKSSLEKEWTKVLLKIVSWNNSSSSLDEVIKALISPEWNSESDTGATNAFLQLFKKMLYETPNYFPYFLEEVRSIVYDVRDICIHVLENLNDNQLRKTFLQSASTEWVIPYLRSKPDLEFFFELPDSIQHAALSDLGERFVTRLDAHCKETLFSEEKERAPLTDYLAGVTNPIEIQLTHCLVIFDNLANTPKKRKALRNLLQTYIEGDSINVADALTHNVSVEDFFRHDDLIPRLTKAIKKAYSHKAPEPIEEFLQTISEQWALGPGSPSPIDNYRAERNNITTQIHLQVKKIFNKKYGTPNNSNDDGGQKPSLLQHSLKEESLNKIADYLAGKPSDVKTEYFIALRALILAQPLTPTLLQKKLISQRREGIKLEDSDLFKLFYSRLRSSKAKECEASLYALSTADELNEHELNEMCTFGFLPNVAKTPKERALEEIEKYFDLNTRVKWKSTVQGFVNNSETLEAFNKLVNNWNLSAQDMQPKNIIDTTLLNNIREILSPILSLISQHMPVDPTKNKDFFQKLQRIVEDKKTLSLNQLQQELTQYKSQLSLPNGRLIPEAEKLIISLVAQLTGGRKMDAAQREALSLNYLLPDFPTDTDYENRILDKTIKKIMRAPLMPRHTLLEKEIGAIYDQMRSKATFERSQLGMRRFNFERLYQQALLEKAFMKLGEALKSEVGRNFWFDTQRSVLLFVDFTVDDREKMSTESFCEEEKNAYSAEPTKQTFEKITGLQYTSSTLCSLSIDNAEEKKNDSPLQEDFNKWFITRQNQQVLQKPSLFHEYLAEINSVPPLQTEATMHLLLLLETCIKKLGPLYDEVNIDKPLRQALLTEGNKIVALIFAEALEVAQMELDNIPPNKQNEVYFDNLIQKQIAVKRKELFTLCREKFVELITAHHPEPNREAVLSELVTLTKHDYETTVASKLDYLDMDAQSGIVQRITGTEYTAHDKGNAERGMGLRFYYRNTYTMAAGGKPQVKLTVNPRIGARVPSPVNIKTTREVELPEVFLRLETLYAEISTRAPRAGGDVIEGLFTSLPTIDFFDGFGGKNKQTYSTELMLIAMHQLNKKQLSIGSYLFLLPLAVNYHSWSNPSPDTIFTVSTEAALIADMTILATLNAAANLFSHPIMRSRLLQTYAGVWEKYSQFLDTEELPFFQKSQFNAATMAQMDTFKSELLVELNHPQQDKAQLAAYQLMSEARIDEEKLSELPPQQQDQYDFTTLIFLTLLKLYANNLHRNIQFGMLTQTLVMFLYVKTVGGCKSANERGPTVDNRVTMLVEMENNRDHIASDILSTLKAVVTHCNETNVALLEKRLNIYFNSHHLYGAAHIISCTCQGGPAKLHSSPDQNFGSWSSFFKNPVQSANTNIALPSEITRLPRHSKKTEVKKFQSHSDEMAEKMQALFTKALESLPERAVSYRA